MSEKSMKPTPPQSEQQLMERCQTIAGRTVFEIAEHHGFPVPQNLLRDKGWIGQLLEYTLGASAGSRPEPDFPHLGVELKTLPIDQNGKPLETTYISITPLIGVNGLKWEQSAVYKKLKRVLWVPIVAEKSIPIHERIIATPFIWSPSPAEMDMLKQDWEEIMDMIVLGNVEEITGKLGEVMQLRPKAANSKVQTDAIGPNGTTIQTLPKGFYLKSHFTHNILKHAFNL